MPPTRGPLKLPRQLIEQLGGEDALTSRRKSHHHPGTRKDLRKAARIEKKSLRSGPPPLKRKKLQHSEPENIDVPSEISPHRSQQPPGPSRGDTLNAPRPKSILKNSKMVHPESSSESRSRKTSPPASIPKAVKAKLAEDDEEIAALEKKLGLKGKKKLPQSFADDGLDVLLERIDGGSDLDVAESKKRKAEGDEWLAKKRTEARRKAEGRPGGSPKKEDEGSDSFGGSDDDGASDMSLDGPEFPDDVSEETSNADPELDTEDDFDGFESDEHGEAYKPQPRVRENPYVAPSSDKEPTKKYIPPSLRKSTSNSEELVRLRRQTQGLVNRLTEANLISILSEIEKLYRDHPRQHVTSILVDLLLTSVSEPTSLPDTLIILPAGFIAAIYKIVGMDFGAQVVQRTVELFDEHYNRASAIEQVGPAAATTDSSKETSNLIMLLSGMYNFQVVGSNLIFDYIKKFLAKLSELNAELLLKLIRTSGPQLRQDDPSSLKDIVAMLRPAIAQVGEENISVRTKFMIETINDLKNNRMKTGGVASAVTSEHTIRMKKILGSLNVRNIKASEPLRIGLGDIKDSDKKGKWWLVGASWSGDTIEERENAATQATSTETVHTEDSGTSDLAQLAREHRMNTDVRRAIFVAIMSASDFQDAYLRILKLKLRKVQEYEIPKVLIHCAGAEKSYNPYYTLIAKKICGDRRLKTAFQYCLWDLFKKMGESDDNDEETIEDDSKLDTRQLVNLAKMFGTLIAEGGLELGVLRNLNLSYLQPKTKTFMEVLFITIFLQSQKQSETRRDKEAVTSILSKAKDTPQLVNGLQYLLKRVISKTEIAGGKDQTATVKWACKVAGDTLEALVAIDGVKQ